jgi:sortase A
LFVAAAAVIAAIALPVARPYLDILEVFTLAEAPQFDENGKVVFASAAAEPDAGVDAEKPVYATPPEGEEYATLIIPSAGIEVPVYYGDGPAELKKGVGTYMGAWVPGQGHTVVLAGHNNNFFLTLPDAEVGDVVTMKTNYGDFRYRITGSQITRFDDMAAYDLLKEGDNLIMYTCNNSIPFGATPWRHYVYAEYIPDEPDGGAS